MILSTFNSLDSETERCGSPAGCKAEEAPTASTIILASSLCRAAAKHCEDWPGASVLLCYLVFFVLFYLVTSLFKDLDKYI